MENKFSKQKFESNINEYFRYQHEEKNLSFEYSPNSATVIVSSKNRFSNLIEYKAIREIEKKYFIIAITPINNDLRIFIDLSIETRLPDPYKTLTGDFKPH